MTIEPPVGLLVVNECYSILSICIGESENACDRV
jgi:hypothetical protein